MYVKVVDNAVDVFPYSVARLKRDNPQVSYPKNMSDSEWESFGMYKVSHGDLPTYNVRTEKVVRSETPTNIAGVWTLTYTSTAKTSEEIQNYDEQVAKNNRGERDTLLANTDWTQMNDSPLSNEAKTEWATYRQELRGITDLDAWPNLEDDDWPVQP